MEWEDDRKVDEWMGCGFATEIARLWIGSDLVRGWPWTLKMHRGGADKVSVVTSGCTGAALGVQQPEGGTALAGEGLVTVGWCALKARKSGSRGG